MSATYKTAIHWFRRDLRLNDNTALFHACKRAEDVIPVYVASDWKESHRWTGPPRQAFLCGCLESLAKSLETTGSRLIVRQGAAVEELGKLIRETKADAVFFNRDPDPFGRETERKVAELCSGFGIDLHAYKDAVLHEPDEVLNGSGAPYRVYTAYSKNWFGQPKPEPLGRPRKISTPSGIKSIGTPTLDFWKLPANQAAIVKPGERAGRNRLKKALTGPLLEYAERRDDPSSGANSSIGPDLRFGTISVREVFHQTQQAAREAETDGRRKSLHIFLKQLAWREFYVAILGHYPNVLDESFAPQWRDVPWGDADENFKRWKQGRTGFPIVDAGMRQLLATGYMHNRVRMIVAMFLTKDLHLHWRLGEAHFMRHLVDGEIANNNGGWQWSAGTGADAAPYFRIQNPWTQTNRFDPHGEYIRAWVPELSKTDPKRFQKPPGAGPIANDYPLPIVDHKTERERTLEIFKQHRRTIDD
ncbi:MAG: deoxyribodipyrimidine photo-lyase [Verrucomicrobiales bacterium]|jgi:deoxyribodipyrimidine photo-lyase